MQNLTDHELLIKTQEGNHQAFAVLVERHSEKFFRLAYRYLQNQQQAEDVVQDAFIKLWEKPYSWKSNRQNLFTTWFYRVIINRCLDSAKQKEHLPIEKVIDTVKDLSSSQEQEILTEEKRKLIEYEINRLPDRQRTALNLCFFEDLTNQQAAEIMELNIKALQSLIMRAKKTLQKNLNS